MAFEKRVPVRLQKILDDKKLTQKWLADEAKLTPYSVSKLCTGQLEDVVVSTANRICRALNVKYEFLFADVTRK